MYQNATVAEWYKEHGKHAVYANPRKKVPLPAGAHPVTLQVPRDGRLVELVAEAGSDDRRGRDDALSAKCGPTGPTSSLSTVPS